MTCHDHITAHVVLSSGVLYIVLKSNTFSIVLKGSALSVAFRGEDEASRFEAANCDLKSKKRRFLRCQFGTLNRREEYK